MKTLTRRQKEIADFIANFISRHNYAPTFREIASHFRFSSVATVADYIKALKEKKILQTKFNLARSIQLIPVWGKKIEVPLLGIIAAGKPIEAIRTSETIDIPSSMKGENIFALKVRGDSMVRDGILDGDYVIIQPCQTPKNGDIVVALIENEVVSLKRFFKEKDYIRLQPANRKYPPIKTKKVVVQGKVKGVIRKF